MKKFILGFIVGGILFSTMSFALAETKKIDASFYDIKMKINGQIVQMDVQPFIYNNRTYVPARFVAEPLGAEVRWNESTNTVEIDSKVTPTPKFTPTPIATVTHVPTSTSTPTVMPTSTPTIIPTSTPTIPPKLLDDNIKPPIVIID